MNATPRVYQQLQNASKDREEATKISTPVSKEQMQGA